METKAAAQVTGARKHLANDPKCYELGCVCVSLWWLNHIEPGVMKASAIISSIASRLATPTGKQNQVNLVLANATAILSKGSTAQ